MVIDNETSAGQRTTAAFKDWKPAPGAPRRNDGHQSIPSRTDVDATQAKSPTEKPKPAPQPKQTKLPRPDTCIGKIYQAVLNGHDTTASIAGVVPGVDPNRASIELASLVKRGLVIKRKHSGTATKSYYPANGNSPAEDPKTPPVAANNENNAPEMPSAKSTALSEPGGPAPLPGESDAIPKLEDLKTTASTTPPLIALPNYKHSTAVLEHLAAILSDDIAAELNRISTYITEAHS